MCISILIRRPNKAPTIARCMGEMGKAMQGRPFATYVQNYKDGDCLCAVDTGTTIRVCGIKASYDPALEAWDWTLPSQN